MSRQQSESCCRRRKTLEENGNVRAATTNPLVGFWNEGAAELLRKTLEDKGLRVEVLAERLKVSAKSVRNWLITTRRPTRPGVDNLAALCAELGLTPDDFRAAANAYEARSRENIASTGTQQESDVTASAPEGRAENRSSPLPQPAEIAPLPDSVADVARVDEPPAWPGVGSGNLPDGWSDNSPRNGGRRAKQRTWLLVVGVLTVAAAGGYAVLHVRPDEVKAPPVTFEIPPELAGVYDRAVGGELSPDGTRIAFVARSTSSGQRMLFVHSVIERTTKPLRGSEGNFTNFFWGADSRSVFFISSHDLVRVSVAGEGAERIGHAAEGLKGAVNAKGVIVLGSRKGLLRMTPSGKPELLTEVRPGESTHTSPIFLRDQDQILFTITGLTPDQEPTLALAVYSLRSRSMRTLFAISSGSQYVNGQLLYVRARTLFARPFDASKLRYSGPERPIASPVWADSMTGEVGFSASPATILVTPAARIPPLYRVSPNGNTLETISDPRDIRYVAVGGTANQMALVTRGAEDTGGTLWLFPLDGRERIRIAQVRGEPRSPVFSHDDRTLYYAAAGYEVANVCAVDVPQADGPPRIVVHTGDVVSPRDVSPDGRFLLLQRWATRDADIFYVPIETPQLVRPMVATAEDEGESARFSPDGKRVAFVAKRGAEYSVYITDFPPNRELAKQAITGHGWRARWSRDGRRIFFARGSGVFEADPHTRETKRLFQMKQEIATLETAPDGSFFVREIPIEQNRVVATLWWPRLTARQIAVPVR
jgi:Tol biopolymer transport system component/transcriptional regulator with XRE-family HTH domain